ncbi:carbohydrate sulfotransferase 1-like [Clytia hemisphaerica]
MRHLVSEVKEERIMTASKNYSVVALAVFLSFWLVFTLKYSETTEGVIRNLINPSPRRTQKDHKVLFILGPGRSGTSLLGDLFNSRKDFIYFFEPLKAIRTYHKIGEPTSIHQLQYMLQEVGEYMKDIVSCNYRSRNDKYINLVHSGGMFFSKMDFLHSPPFCAEGERNCKKKNITSSMMNEMCDHLDEDVTIVIKDLYKNFPYFDPSLIQYVQLNKMKTFHVLQALRDPRAILNSYRKLNWITDNVRKDVNRQASTAVPIFCGRLVHILKHFPKAPGSNKVKYAIFRYDDMAYHDITSIARSLAEFLDVDLSDEFENYLREKTQGEDDFKTASLSLAPRNISLTILNWRKEIPMDLLEQIESTESCQQLLQMLGYKMAENKEVLFDEHNVLVKEPLLLDVIGH